MGTETWHLLLFVHFLSKADGAHVYLRLSYKAIQGGLASGDDHILLLLVRVHHLHALGLGWLRQAVLVLLENVGVRDDPASVRALEGVRTTVISQSFLRTEPDIFIRHLFHVRLGAESVVWALVLSVMLLER